MQTSPRDWLRTGVAGLSDWQRTKALVKDTTFRLERKWAKRYSDVQLRQLRAIENGYARPNGPDLLVFGDSAMFWTTPTDADHRHLVQMIRDELGPQTTFEALVGPGYNARIVMAFLTALERTRSKPKVIIVPASVMMSQSHWLSHPEVGYEQMSDEIRGIVAANGRKRPRRLVQHDTDEAVGIWERTPAPSLFGARRTVGELRLITNAVPATRWQKAVRIRHLMDFYNAERFDADSEGVKIVAQMAAQLRELNVPSVAYIPPINYDVLVATLGAAAKEHVEKNAALLEDAFSSNCGELGHVVNAIWDSPASEYIDPVHLSPAGRQRFAAKLAAVARPYMGDGELVSRGAEPDYDPAAHYDRVTAAWRLLLGEELHYGVFERGDEPLSVATAALTERMIEAAQLGPGVAVLDVGCGTGAPACDLAQRFGVRVLGITTSAVGVEQATARATDRGLSEHVSFEVRDGTDNGLGDESFDRVWVLEASHLMRERERLIEECARVLAPGGRFILCDITRQREIPFREVRERRDDFVTLRTAFGDARMEPLSLYGELAAGEGLTVERADDLTEATLPTFDRWRANASAHADEVRDALGADGLEAFVSSCDILERFWRDGTFGYGLLAASKPGPGPG